LDCLLDCIGPIEEREWVFMSDRQKIKYKLKLIFFQVNVILKKDTMLIQFICLSCKDSLIHLSMCIFELNIGFVFEVYMPFLKTNGGKEEHLKMSCLVLLESQPNQILTGT